MNRPGLDVGVLRTALAPAYARVEVVDSTTSTNAVLLGDGEAPDRSVLVAESQSAGRGRLDRSWMSPPRAGLLFSVRLHPSPPVARWSWLPLLAGVALHEAVTAATGLAVRLKWPNDLLADDGCKLAGVLAQSGASAVVVGIGLNVTTTRQELSLDTATSLQIRLDRSRRAGAATAADLSNAVPTAAETLDRTQLLVAILSRLDGWLARWSAAGGDAGACGLHAAYCAVCASVGREVSVTTTGGDTVVGQAIGIDPDGQLQVASAGTVRTFGAGDVEHLRAAS